MEWENKLSQTLKIKYPIVQAPMLGVTTPEMAATVSNLGGLGSLPVGGLSPVKTTELIRKTKALTNAPFAVNVFSHPMPEAADKQTCELMQDLLEKICSDAGIDFERQAPESLQFHSYKAQVKTLLHENIPVVSFTFGALDQESIKAFKDRGVLLIGTATCFKEAKILDDAGIDIITAQGIEAGGHRGTFLEKEPLPAIGLMSLIPQLVHRIQKPVLAAGGINDGRTIKAALILGAMGVQIGTAFIGSTESKAIPAYKQSLGNTVDTDSILTKAYSGRWARGLQNKFIREIEKSGLSIPGFPVQGSLTSSIRQEGEKRNIKELTALWAGQSAFRSEIKPISEIFKNLINDTENIG